MLRLIHDERAIRRVAFHFSSVGDDCHLGFSVSCTSGIADILYEALKKRLSLVLNHLMYFSYLHVVIEVPL